MIDSDPISQFLETTYPDPPLPMKTEWGGEIETKARTLLGPVIRSSVMPREIRILSPRSQEYFRTSREALLGHPLENLLDTDKEEKTWAALDDHMRTVGQLMRKHSSDGPFLHGARPCYTDFFIAGSLETIRVVDEDVFQKMVKYPGFSDVYTACLPWMERRD